MAPVIQRLGPQPPDRFLHYERIVRLGAGGVGQVWLYRDARADRRVAIKFSKETTSPEDFSRVLSEARRQAACRSPFICTVYSVEEGDDLPGIVMEYADSGSLAGLLKNGTLSMGRTLHVTRDILTALCVCHSAVGGALIHKDLKPDNVLLFDSGERAKLTDFSHAVRLITPGDELEGLDLGTPEYFAPEQIRDQWSSYGVTERTDIWGVGVMMYQMLTGRLPYDLQARRPLHDTAPCHLERFATDPIGRKLPDGVHVLLSRLLAWDPSDRPDAHDCLLEVMALIRREADRKVHFEASALLDILGPIDCNPPGRPRSIYRDLSDRVRLGSQTAISEVLRQYPQLVFRTLASGQARTPRGIKPNDWEHLLRWFKSVSSSGGRPLCGWSDLSPEQRRAFADDVWRTCAKPVRDLVKAFGVPATVDSSELFETYVAIQTESISHERALVLAEALAGGAAVLVTGDRGYLDDRACRQVLAQNPDLDVVCTRNTPSVGSADEETRTA